FMLRLEMVDEALTSLELMEHEGELTSYGKALLAEAYLRRSESDKAAKLLLEAVKLDGDLNPPFSCTQCGTYSQDWFSKCSSCSSWASAEILEDDLTSSSAATSGTLTEASR
ncbi:MAG: hypothetical protein KAR06_11555, partial [Deltaproteobacteria bacterium]|nr:hypothetical protein [Deltaproteobacteria bacterium]